MELSELLIDKVKIMDNIIVLKEDSSLDNQAQTNEIFGDKWKKVDEQGIVDNNIDFQKRWYLGLYGFRSEDERGKYLQSKSTILDAAYGFGYKASWFAELAPECTIIGIDFSDAAHKYKQIPNLYFIKGDTADSGIKEGAVDYVSCDQVLHHTEDLAKTSSHLTSQLSE
ncbi:MAG: methyltransferase domain-containing protein [Flavobacteriales bacterium]|nr:methyltransferase domain-containing protein [Flavobacteriales bacterium]